MHAYLCLQAKWLVVLLETGLSTQSDTTSTDRAEASGTEPHSCSPLACAGRMAGSPPRSSWPHGQLTSRGSAGCRAGGQSSAGTPGQPCRRSQSAPAGRTDSKQGETFKCGLCISHVLRCGWVHTQQTVEHRGGEGVEAASLQQNSRAALQEKVKAHQSSSDTQSKQQHTTQEGRGV